MAADCYVTFTFEYIPIEEKQMKKVKNKIIKVKSPFKLGDVVNLKSGGPKMTVTRQSVSESGKRIYAFCTWVEFHSTDREWRTNYSEYPVEALELRTLPADTPVKAQTEYVVA